MNFPFYISKRIQSAKSNAFAYTISRLAIASIAIGLGAMVMAYFILGGFQRTIKNKIYDFKGQIEVTKFDLGSSYDEKPIASSQEVVDQILSYPFVSHLQFFAHKAGMFKTEDEVEGILFKGVSPHFALDRFKQYIIDGSFISFQDSSYSKEVIISNTIARKLYLNVGDYVTAYFVQNPPRFRKLEIVGIFETGLEEIDKTLVIGDIGLIQRLNNWPDTLVGGFEIFLEHPEQEEMASEVLFENLDSDLYVEKISEKYLNIFDWLNLIDQNVAVFLWLILIVACINMVSILLILIMERTNMIGVLAALGASRSQLKKIFLINGMLLVFKGLIIGNLGVLGLAYLQDKFHLIPLDPANYYMHFVPIEWDYGALLYVNALTFVVVTLALFLPLLFISRIQPIAAIKFD